MEIRRISGRLRISFRIRFGANLLVVRFYFVQILNSHRRRIQHWRRIVDSNNGSSFQLHILWRFPRRANVLRRQILELRTISPNEAAIGVPFTRKFNRVKSFDRNLIGKSAASYPKKVASVQCIISVKEKFFKELKSKIRIWFKIIKFTCCPTSQLHHICPTVKKEASEKREMWVIHPSVFICLTAASIQGYPVMPCLNFSIHSAARSFVFGSLHFISLQIRFPSILVKLLTVYATV